MKLSLAQASRNFYRTQQAKGRSGKPPSKTLMLGLDAAGKTTLLYKLRLGEVVTTIPTTGFNLETVKINDTSFNVWDIGYGSHHHLPHPSWRHYYPDTDAVIFVVDSSDAERLGEAKEALDTMLSEDLLQKKPLLVFSNKVDLPMSKNTTEMTDLLCLQKYNGREWFIQESNAISGLGIEEGFQWLAKQITIG